MNDSAGRWTAHAREQSTLQSGERAATQADESLDFVRFCYRRRRVAWPELYDEMCAVAARGAYRGLGYTELADHGIHFSLPELPRLAELTRRVMQEERLLHEPGGAGYPVPMMLAAQPARS